LKPNRSWGAMGRVSKDDSSSTVLFLRLFSLHSLPVREMLSENLHISLQKPKEN
jgi:hypothetical protein